MSAIQVATDFKSEVASVTGTLSDAEQAFKKGHLKLETFHSVVELALLSVMSNFETFVEELFYSSALGQSGYPAIKPTLNLANRNEVDMVIYSTGRRKEKYLDWLPYDIVLGRADVFLTDGAPFAWIKHRPYEQRVIDECTVLRNAVAHRSGHAHSRFVDLANVRRYQAGRPAEFLLSTRGPDREFELLNATLVSIADALSCPSEHDADQILQRERDFGNGTKAPAGRFVCVSCGNVRAHAGGSLSLPLCNACPPNAAACASCGRGRSSSWRRLL